MKILLFGRDGQVGTELRRTLPPIGTVIALGHDDADFSDPESIRARVRDAKPDIVVNAAAYTAVDKAESEPELAHTVNATSVGVLAQECAHLGAWLVHYSTDYVFDGTKRSPYVETDATRPLSVYGSTKLAGEEAIRIACGPHLLFRTCWVYAVHGSNFIGKILQFALQRHTIDVVDDQHGAPTNAALIADATAHALRCIVARGTAGSALSGTYHLAAAGGTTWYDVAVRVVEIARAAGLPITLAADGIRRVKSTEFPSRVARPAYSVLSTEKISATFGFEVPDWRDGLEAVVTAMTRQGVR